MTIKQFIEAAIEGGYPDILALTSGAFGIHQSQLTAVVKGMVLDPRAWRAVGKVKGWEGGSVCGSCEYPGYQLDPNYHMSLMINALCAGKTLEEYIATL